MKKEEKNKEKYPYKLARIVRSKNNDYIVYSIWNKELGRLQIKKQYTEVTEEEVRRINKLFEHKDNNIHIRSNAEQSIIEKETLKKNITLVEALQIALDAIKSSADPKSLNSYKTPTKFLTEFIERDYKGIELQKFETSIMEEFLNEYQEKRKWKPKTRNSHVENLNTLFNYLKRLGYLKENVLQSFEKQKNKSSTYHRTYNKQQRELLKETISKENPQLWLMCIFLFYTLARPNEIRRFKIGYIDLENNKIFIPSTISKNESDGVIDLPIQLRQILIDNGIFNYPSDFYILGKEGRPSKECHPRYSFSKKYKIFRDNLGFDKEYTMYSWKHTGASELYKSPDVDILEVQQQCRHSDLNETRNYLRSLGVYSSNKIKNNYPTL